MLKLLFEIVLTILISSASSLLGQQAFAATEGKPQMRMFTSGDVVFMSELGAVILLKDKSLVIDVVNSAEQRAEVYKSVDLKQNDEVIMINGKKVTILTDLKAAYDSVAVGSDVKLGIKRGKDMMIVSFPKMDQSSMKNQRVMSFTTDGSGEASAGVSEEIASIHASDGEVAIVMELGLIVGESGSKVKVAGLINNQGDESEAGGALEGDVITSIMAQKVTSIKELTEAYDKVEVGKEFSVTLDRNGKAVTIKAVKAAKQDGPTMFKTIKTTK